MPDQALVFVTGGTGFLGSWLLRRLVEKGYRIRALRRPDSSMDLVRDIADGIEWVAGDVTDVVSLEAAFVGVTHVFHAAAMISFHPRDALRMEQVNVEGTANVVNLSLDFGVRKLIYVSSVSAIGRSRLQSEVDEKSQWVRSKSITNYAQSKYLAEQEVWRGHAEGLPVAIVNPSMILGNGFWSQGTGRFFSLVDEGLRFAPIGTAGFVDVRDVARYMVQLLESDIDGQRYILNAQNLTFSEFFQMIALAIGKKTAFIKITPLLAEVGWRFEWLKERLLGTVPALTKESARASVSSYTFRNDKSKSLFGFEYTPVDQSIRDMASQFLADKNKKTT
jgi:nucleoside-diphosphate-sugar epimerase